MAGERWYFWNVISHILSIDLIKRDSVPKESRNNISLFSKTFPHQCFILHGFNLSSLFFVQEPVSCQCSDAEGLLANLKGINPFLLSSLFKRIVILLQCLIQSQFITQPDSMLTQLHLTSPIPRISWPRWVTALCQHPRPRRRGQKLRF